VLFQSYYGDSEACFSDASEKAYAELFTVMEGIVTSQLIAAKTRVAPIKKHSLRSYNTGKIT